MKVLVIGKIDINYLAKKLSNVTFTKNKTEKDIVGIIIRNTNFLVNQEFLEPYTQLKFIFTATTGTDNFDISYLKSKNIILKNTPGLSSRSVAELVLGLLLTGTRKIAKADKILNNGLWQRERLVGNELQNKKIGIVGLGLIGSELAKILNALEMQVLGYDSLFKGEDYQKINVTQTNNLSDLSKKCNYLVIIVPKNKYTTGMVGLDVINNLQKPSGLINSARGGVVVEDDVITSINQGNLGFYASDVFEDEPLVHKDMLNRNKIVKTPHIGANTVEAQQRILDMIISYVVDFEK